MGELRLIVERIQRRGRKLTLHLREMKEKGGGLGECGVCPGK